MNNLSVFFMPNEIQEVPSVGFRFAFHIPPASTQWTHKICHKSMASVSIDITCTEETVQWNVLQIDDLHQGLLML